jgi:hypothetical protein
VGGGIFFMLTLLLFGAYALATPRSAREKVMILAALVLFAVLMPFASQMGWWEFWW